MFHQTSFKAANAGVAAARRANAEAFMAEMEGACSSARGSEVLCGGSRWAAGKEGGGEGRDRVRVART